MSLKCIFKRSLHEKEVERHSSYSRSISFINLSEDGIKANIEIERAKFSSCI